MNIAHRSIWNSALGAWVAVSEITRARGKRSGGARTALATGSVLALGLLLGSAPAMAGGEGGYGGGNADPNQAGSGWTVGDSTTGVGGRGGDGFGGIGNGGGSGGSTGNDGIDGGHGIAGGSGGGGGGGTGVTPAANLSNTSMIQGGNGGRGGSNGSADGGGGGGGAGVVTTMTLGNTGTIQGGNGGTGSFGFSNVGGGGGAGVLGNGPSVIITNTGTITGGNGGGAGTYFLRPGRGGAGEGGAAGGDRTGAFGQGGAGIIGSNLSITNSGNISGGLSGNNVRAAAVAFTGGSNSLVLQTGSVLTGAIDIRSGATASIVAGNTGLAVGDVILDGNGTVDTNGNAFTVSGAISGTSGLSKIGAGTLTLSGANNYTGGTTISAGTLTLDAGGSLAATGAVNVNGAGAAFDISAAGNQTIGSLAGVTGSTLALGANTLTLGDASNQTFGGAINGINGGLSKQGSGNLVLTGINTYSGATSINAGTLSVNGSIANSAVTVNSSGILGGSGTVGSTLIAAGGVLAPGNSIGTLTVNGNATFAAGSIYRVEVDAAGNNDRINVTGAPGTATINGGTVDVQASAGTYAANTSYTILNATGGRTGNFAGVTSNLAFLTPTLTYDANNVFLNLARNTTSFDSVAITPNQISTATALQNANAGATGDMSTVQTTLTGLSAEQARAAYDSVSGTGLVALRGAGAGFVAGLSGLLLTRLGAVQDGGIRLSNSFSNRPVLLAANDHVSDLMTPVSDLPQKFSLAGGASSPSSSSASSQGRGFWLRGSGGYQNTSSDGNAAASKLRNGGLSAGFDTELREGLVVGAAISSGTSRLSFDNNDAGKSRGTALAVYGSYASGLWAFKGSASLAWNNNHMDRAVTVGALSRTASSDFDSHTLSAYGEATYSMPMNGWTLQPLAALSLSRDKVNGFTETGAGALNLQVAGQTITSTKSLLGAKAAFDTGSVRLEPRILWAHEFGDLNTPMTAQFQGAANASPFQVSGVALKRDTLILGLGASGSIQKNVDLFADVQAEHNSRQNNLALLVGLRVRW